MGAIMAQQVKIKATHKFTRLHKSGLHGREITISDGVFITARAVLV